MTVRDGEVQPDVIAYGHADHGESGLLHIVFEACTALPTGGNDGKRLAAERVDHGGSVDAATAGRVLAREDVGTIIEREPVDGNGPVDGRIHGESDNQIDMLAYGVGM